MLLAFCLEYPSVKATAPRRKKKCISRYKLFRLILYYSSAAYYHDWECGRRVYNYVITENMKRLLRRNYERAVLPHSKAGIIDEKVDIFYSDAGFFRAIFEMVF